MREFFSFGRRSRNPVLSVSFSGRELCTVQEGEIPADKRPVARLADPNTPELRLIDGGGRAYRYDLSSVAAEGFEWFHFSIRVNPTHTVEADCLLSNSQNPPKEDWWKEEKVKGLRFQPIYLSGCKASPDGLIGRGLFYRGLHFSGIITNASVSLLCICDYCQHSFRVQSFHSGFSNLSYFYCSKAPHTLVLSNYLEGAPPFLGKPDPKALAKLEACLPPCEKCGGAFRYLNPFRCPHCTAPYIDFQKHPNERETEYYGNHLYGDALQKYSGRNGV